MRRSQRVDQITPALHQLDADNGFHGGFHRVRWLPVRKHPRSGKALARHGEARRGDGCSQRQVQQAFAGGNTHGAARHCSAWHGVAGQGAARATRSGLRIEMCACRCEGTNGMARRGLARRGEARFGNAWAANAAGRRFCRLPGAVAPHGREWQGMAVAGRGQAGRGMGRLRQLNFNGITMQQITVTITGKAPLLMHSDRFANPLDPATKAHKELTGKRKKTDADHEAIARSEFMGSLYHDDAIGPYIPGQNIDAALQDAAKLQKLGKRFKQAVMVIENEVPLQYKGPRDREGLFAGGFLDVRGVKVAMAKLMRCRPKFNQWSAEFTIAFNEEVLNIEEIRKAVADAGQLIGLCDYRPRFGKFTAEIR